MKQTKTSSSVRSCHVLPKRRLMIVQDDGLSNEGDAIVVKLRHPQTEEGAFFLLNTANSTVQEILKLSDNYRSYFIDETVSSDKDIYLSTPIDPLFLVLPYLLKSKRCSPVDHVVTDDTYPEIGYILKNPRLTKEIHLIADQKGDESLKAFIYNEEKTLNWLKRKIVKLMDVLKQKSVHTSVNSATSASFVKSDKQQDSDDSYLRYAYGMILDYIPEELAPKLANFIELPPEPVAATKRKEIVSPLKEPNKRAKIEEDFISVAKAPEEKKVTAKQQALAKAAKGSKSISSFFKKKE